MAKFTNTSITDGGTLTFPVGNTATRPSVITTVQSFTSAGTSSWICPTGVTQVEVLVVAGGGGGGSDMGGGGGGGGVIYRPAFPVTPGSSYTVTVGAGGAGAVGYANTPPAGTNGGNSVFGSLTAIGGGGGGSGHYYPSPYAGVQGRDGGSGGGDSPLWGRNDAIRSKGTPGQGTDGGLAARGGDGWYSAGGGGGAGEQGGDGAINVTAGGGGRGLPFSILGPTYYFAAGGGGAGYQNISGSGGLGGGGGAGGWSGGTIGTGGTGGLNNGGNGGQPGNGGAAGANTGSGGGGGGHQYNGGAGGSGIVVLRYSVASDSTTSVGFTHYNTDTRDVETYTGSAQKWVGTDAKKNFAGHNIFTNSSLASFSTGQNLNLAAASGIAPPITSTVSVYYATENTTTNTSHSVYYPQSGTANSIRCMSIFAKADSNNRGIHLYADGTSPTIGGVYFDLITGVATLNPSYGSSSRLGYGSQYWGNGWWRCWIAGQPTNGATSYYFHVDTALNGAVNYAGTVGAGVYLWGPQMEEGVTSPGPYTPTSGVASPVPNTVGSYRVHSFTNTGTTRFVPAVSGTVEVLVVAGGGGGGMDMGGGGGGGGVIYQTSYAVVSGEEYTVTVGAGGWGAPAPGTNRGDGVGPQPGGHQYTVRATNGGNSQFGSLIAIGGGYGASSYWGYTPDYGYGGFGGSGGGASGYSDGTGNGGTAGAGGRGGSGIAGQGNRGGDGTGQYYSGGGGGAGGHGGEGTQYNAADGGPGLPFSILGQTFYWGGGGGGAGYSTYGGNGGIGGGGAGAVGTNYGGAGGLNLGSNGGGGAVNTGANTPGGDAGTNTGGGGGGGSHYNASNKGGNGGSGIVVVRYKYQ